MNRHSSKLPLLSILLLLPLFLGSSCVSSSITTKQNPHQGSEPDLHSQDALAPSQQDLLSEYARIVHMEKRFVDLDKKRGTTIDTDHWYIIKKASTWSGLEIGAANFTDQLQTLPDSQKQELRPRLLQIMFKEGFSYFAAPALLLIYTKAELIGLLRDGKTISSPLWSEMSPDSIVSRKIQSPELFQAAKAAVK